MSDYNPMDIELQAEGAKEKALNARMEKETEESDIQWLMGSKRGRRIVWRFLDQSGVFRSSFSTTAMQMAFNEGYRNFGNRTLGLVHQHCPGLYPLMVKEHNNGRKPDEERHNNQ